MSDGVSAPARGETFTLVQALRGLAALWVVLFHASEGRHIDALRAALPHAVNTILFDAGHYGVSIFFALSGFVIAHSLRDAAMTWRFLGRFIVRRSVRLDPAYWASIVFVLLLALLSAKVKREAFAWPDPGTIGAHLLYLQVVLQRPEINVVYWTLTYEVQFYLFLTSMLVLAATLARRGAAWGAAMAWGTMMLLAIGSAMGAWAGLPVGLFPGLWAAFFAGVLAYHAPHRRAALGALIVLCALMGAIQIGHDLYFNAVSAATAALLFVALRTGYVRRGLNWRWLQSMGTISYSLYLLHNPLTGAIGFVARHIVGEGLAASAATLVVIVGVSVGVATLFWRAIEMPSHRLSRGIRLPRAADRKVAGSSLADTLVQRQSIT